MLNDKVIQKAVSKIFQRAEKQIDVKKITDIFVDVGFIDQLNNRNNQIIFGRRGTGKTHALRYLESEFYNETDVKVIYIDARVLGSSNQFSDTQIPIKKRCLSLFKDILDTMTSSFLESIVEYDDEKQKVAFKLLDELTNEYNEPKMELIQTSKTVKSIHGERSTGRAKAEISSQPKIELNKVKEKSVKDDTEAEYQVQTENKIIFPQVYKKLSDLLIKMNVDLYILFDEWSSLPEDVQPYLAEFIKRSFLANNRITIKIASLEYRSKFNIKNENNYFGFELGSDISVGTDIDDYFVYDRNPEVIQEQYKEILYNHIKSELPDTYLEEYHNIYKINNFINSLFTSQNTFIELVRAAEGVIRDFINIFSISFFDASRKKKNKIEKPNIIEAAQKWFEQDKNQNLNNNLKEFLQVIINEVIGKRKARSFLIHRVYSEHKGIKKLFDYRVLHLIRKGYADKENPGERYNIYSLDYGTYVDLIRTSKEPELDFVEIQERETEDFIVPFDDNRSIRRIILDNNILEKYN